MLGRRRSRDARLAETEVGPTDFRRNKPTGIIGLATGVRTSLKPIIPEPAMAAPRPLCFRSARPRLSAIEPIASGFVKCSLTGRFEGVDRQSPRSYLEDHR